MLSTLLDTCKNTFILRCIECSSNHFAWSAIANGEILYKLWVCTISLVLWMLALEFLQFSKLNTQLVCMTILAKHIKWRKQNVCFELNDEYKKMKRNENTFPSFLRTHHSNCALITVCFANNFPTDRFDIVLFNTDYPYSAFSFKYFPRVVLGSTILTQILVDWLSDLLFAYSTVRPLNKSIAFYMFGPICVGLRVS